MPETCTAFVLDLTCVASDPCQVHGCKDVDAGDSSGCYCDPERPRPEPCAWTYREPAYPPTGDPGEFCEDPAVDGEPYCAEHGRLADG